MKREVTGTGPVQPGGIVIVGEAPGRDEIERGIPFVGPAGKVLRNKILQAGLQEKDIRFENVIEYKLEDNDVSKLYVDSAKQIPGEELRAWFSDLRSRVAGLAPSVVIACGETALQACTGARGIGKVHCTVMEGINEIKGIPIIPTYHPAFLLPMRAPEMAPWLVFGLSKARQIAGGKKDINRVFEIEPTFSDALARIEDARSCDKVSIDIETTRNTKEITCFGIGLSDSRAICIPFSRPGKSYWTEEQEKEIWLSIAKLCRTDNEKIFQNFIFDTMFLSRFGIEVCGRIFDTMLAGHVLQPELRKGLADLARLYTFAPPWKGAQDWSVSSDPRGLWEYNAKDAAITYEIAGKQRGEMAECGLQDYYEKCVAPLCAPVYTMCVRGWRIDTIALESAKKEMEEKCSTLKNEIVELAGLPKFNPNSHQQVKELCNSLGIDIPVKLAIVDGEREWVETTDETALLKIIKKYPEYKIFPKLLEHRKYSKRKSTYCDVDLDPDGRLRFSINIAGTVSGRFSSSQSPWDTGLNSQNVPESFRHVVIPDPNKILIQVDLKQAEARVVAWLSGEEALEKILENGGDIHTNMANLIFKLNISELADAERKRKRFLGKTSVHMFNYQAYENKFIDTCLLEGDVSVSMEEATEIKNTYYNMFPGIPRWHNEMKQMIKATRVITTPYGAARQFYGRMNDKLVREALNYLPQHIVSQYLNQVWLGLEAHKDIQVLGQCHDSLLMQTDVDNLSTALTRIKKQFDGITVRIRDKDRVIPYDIFTGSNWADMREIK